MALVETVALVLGPSIAKALLKSWLGENVAVDVLGEIIDRLKTKGGDVVTDRNNRRQLEQVGEQVAARMRPVFDIEAASLDQQGRDTVVREVAATLEQARVTTDLLVACNLDANRLTQHLASLRPDATNLLSATEAALYQRTLSEASASIIPTATQLTGFNGSAFAATLQGQDQLFAMLSELLQRPDAQAEQFEHDYHKAVTRQLDKMEQFGVPRMDALVRRQSLSVAYVTLQVEHRATTKSKSFTKARRDQSEIDTTLFSAELSDRSLSDSNSLEHVLGRTRRLVVRGDAGLGKSTLLQWIAVRAAHQDFPSHLASWNNCVPFFIRLRERVGKAFPMPEEFPGLVARNIVGDMPQGWVHHQLKTGRAVVLVDGVDELPFEQRADMLAQLEQLVADYPLARYVVTSRPYALKAEQWPEWADWIARENFDQVTLQPMSVPQTESFIDQWHKAFRDTTTDQDEREELEELAPHLKRLLRRRAPLRRLATSPLLCAMICALHRERRQQLPSERIKLYEECVEMLLSRRDEGRRINLDGNYPDMS